MNALVNKLIRGGKKSPFPARVSPMLATLTKSPVTKPGYFHEVKFDGYRIIAFCQKGKVRLDSRSGLNYTAKYPSVEAALKNMKLDIVLDGEICALDTDGKPDFETLQRPDVNTPIVFYAYDILWLNGYNLMDLPLIARKRILKAVIGKNKWLLYSEHFTDGPKLFDQVQAMGLEGIVSKKMDSKYIPGYRGDCWYKTSISTEQDFIVVGWVESERGRQFGSLLFGAYHENKLYWVGHSGGGFKDKEMPVILKKLKAIEVKRKPFVNRIHFPGIYHWVKPRLVATIKFATYTKNNRIRKPAIFLGFNKQVSPKEVTWVPPSGTRSSSLFM